MDNELCSPCSPFFSIFWSPYKKIQELTRGGVYRELRENGKMVLRGFCGVFVGAESFWSSQQRNATERFLSVEGFCWGFW